MAQTKSLKLYYTHTKERAKITFKKNGRYDQAGLKRLNVFLRDWRRNEPTKMDPRLFDLVWEVYRQSGAKDYIHVVSAYRSPQTNEMLRKTRGGQASKSQHMYGRAMDFYIPGVKISRLREIAMKLQGGGVGYYPKSASPFVHLDVASVRAWPRMSRAQLVKLFPKGKTLHLPSDGKPLPGYQVALAEYKRRKGKIASTPAPAKAKSQPKTTLVAKADTSSQNNKKNSGNLFSNLFGRNNKNADNGQGASETVSTAPNVVVASLPQTAQNFASLPRVDIPVPVMLDNGATDPAAEQISSEQTIVEVVPEEPVKPDITAEPQEVLVASLPVPALSDTPLPDPVQELAYQEQISSSATPASFAAIMAVAIETDKKRKLNGEVPAPTLSASLSGREPKRIDIASIETPNLKEHNRLARADFGAAVAKAAEAANHKKGRPNLRDALSTRYRAKSTAPDLETIQISRRVFSKDNIVDMKPPAKAPRFVNRYMRQPPKIIYATGFSRNNLGGQNRSSFSGNAVNFLPVIKYGS